MSLVIKTSHPQKREIKREKRYNIVFSGEIAPGHTAEEVEKKLATYFNKEITRVEFLFTGKPFVIKQEVDYKTALKYQIIFEWSGAFCHIESTTQEPDENFIGKQHCNVIFEGEINERYTLEEVKTNLKGLLHLNDRRIEQLFSGQPVVLMKDVDYHPALKIQASFELAGARCKIEEIKQELTHEKLAHGSYKESTPQDSSELMICPHCSFKQKKFRICRRCGVYIEKYHSNHHAPKTRKSGQSVKKVEALMEKELFNWGVGLIILGVIQLANMGLWALFITGVGGLNLFIKRRPLFIINGLTFFVSGALNLVLMTMNSFLGTGKMGIYAGTGQFGLIVIVGLILLVSIAQMYAGVRSFGRFKKYASTILSKQAR